MNERFFVNIYKDKNGKFISDKESSSYEQAFENRDKLSTYVETVEIIRHDTNELSLNKPRYLKDN